jgi:hypothetical protein
MGVAGTCAHAYAEARNRSGKGAESGVSHFASHFSAVSHDWPILGRAAGQDRPHFKAPIAKQTDTTMQMCVQVYFFAASRKYIFEQRRGADRLR